MRARGRHASAVTLFLPIFAPAPAPPTPAVDPTTYDRVVVAFSGGKDSIACVLALLEAGVPRERIELWHHLVDGREGSTLMDWPCTEAYVRAFGRALGIPVCFSWRIGGFEREMLRSDERTAPIAFERPDGSVVVVGGKGGRRGTRRRYPQTSPDLTVRWCSAYLKNHVGTAALRNQPRFRRGRTLFVSGERAAESPHRATYAAFEPHEADLRTGHRYQRHIDHWRAVHAWSEEAVWSIIERWRINPHPAYRLGFGRVSCSICIFASDRQVATIRLLHPAQFLANAAYEAEFGHTIHRTLPLAVRAARGRPFRAGTEEDVRAALSPDFQEPIVLAPGTWRLPAGAFGESSGPP
jgi:3'-phosphoadenosine 5'-phosphosulfate sulfotransferase (PAPS reductase)/FAD synthetase